MQYPKTEGLFPVDDQYLIGADLMVKPVTAPGVVESIVKFPTDDIWYDAETLVRVAGSGAVASFTEVTVPSDLDTIPVFQRGGSVISRKLRLRRSTHMMTNDPYTLYFALDANLKAKGSLYMDDEVTFNHQTKAEYALATFTADFGNTNKAAKIQNMVEVGAGWEGRVDSLSHGYMIERMIVMGLPRAPSSIEVGGTSLGFTYDTDAKVLVIRKPDVTAIKNWDMTIMI